MKAGMHETVSDAEITVVIPYFQRQRGILARALRSVMAQDGDLQVRIVIVDDESPVSALSELESLGAPTRFPVKVILRPNGGPGAARNSALDTLGAEARYVAYLDSDDEWSPKHLLNAKSALEAGFDVYFADLMQLNADVSAFNRRHRLLISEHPVITDAPFLHEYVGDMFTQIISGNVIGTSTVVYRFDRFRDVRFRPEFRTAGEDYLFWMDLATTGARFAFSEQVEAVYGTGVNVYSGVQWGSIELLWRTHYEIGFRTFSLSHYHLDEAQRQLIADRRLALRSEFAKACLHRLARLKPIPRKLWRAHIDSEPAALMDVFRTALGLPLIR